MEGLILRLTLLISLGLCIHSCKKEEQTLPAMTREGRNTMGFRLESGGLVGGQLEGDDGFYFIDNTLSIYLGCHFDHSFLQSSPTIFLYLDLYKNPLTNDFELADAVLVNDMTSSYWSNESYLDTNQANLLQINYTNEDRKIVSGQFDLNFIAFSDTMWTSDTTYYIDTLIQDRVYDGRFDIKYD